MRELDSILAFTDSGKAQHLFCDMGRLPEPKPGVAGQEDSLREGSAGLPCQVPTHSPPSTSPSSCSGSGHHLAWLLRRQATNDEYRTGMVPEHAISSSSSLSEGDIA